MLSEAYSALTSKESNLRWICSCVSFLCVGVPPFPNAVYDLRYDCSRTRAQLFAAIEGTPGNRNQQSIRAGAEKSSRITEQFTGRKIVSERIGKFCIRLNRFTGPTA